VLAAGLVTSAALADTPPNVEPKADDLLKRMSTELGNMKGFSVETAQVMEVVTREGEKLQGIAGSTVHVQRPNKLRTERVGPLGGGTVYYDGKSLSVYGKRNHLYATANVPPTLDETIDFARENLSIDAPGADLLYSDPYKVLMEDVVSGRYLGMEPIGDRMCHHLAYRGHETDWQIWIEDGAHALPCRFVIVSKKQPGEPEYEVTLSGWKPEMLPADSFAFTPPAGATRIQFIQIAEKAKGK
jgi:hypothetical protein